MKIRVNRDACQGHARCATVAPDIFLLDEEGYIRANDIDVPQGMDRIAWKGAKSCPERALQIED